MGVVEHPPTAGSNESGANGKPPSIPGPVLQQEVISAARRAQLSEVEHGALERLVCALFVGRTHISIRDAERVALVLRGALRGLRRATALAKRQR